MEQGERETLTWPQWSWPSGKNSHPAMRRADWRLLKQWRVGALVIASVDIHGRLDPGLVPASQCFDGWRLQGTSHEGNKEVLSHASETMVL